MSKKIPVIELFGPTIQGEGLVTGTITHFLRTGGCSLRCAWCDSMYAVDPEQIKEHATRLKIHEITEHIETLGDAPWMTLTGGDPCIHEELGELVTWLNNRGTRVNVETMGVAFPEWLQQCDVITFSPKPPSSGNMVDISRHANGKDSSLLGWLLAYKKFLKGQVCIKIPCFTEEDIQYAALVYGMLTPESAVPLYDSFYFMAGTLSTGAGLSRVLSEPLDRTVAVLQG